MKQLILRNDIWSLCLLNLGLNIAFYRCDIVLRGCITRSFQGRNKTSKHITILIKRMTISMLSRRISMLSRRKKAHKQSSVSSYMSKMNNLMWHHIRQKSKYGLTSTKSGLNSVDATVQVIILVS